MKEIQSTREFPSFVHRLQFSRTKNCAFTILLETPIDSQRQTMRIALFLAVDFNYGGQVALGANREWWGCIMGFSTLHSARGNGWYGVPNLDNSSGSAVHQFCCWIDLVRSTTTTHTHTKKKTFYISWLSSAVVSFLVFLRLPCTRNHRMNSTKVNLPPQQRQRQLLKRTKTGQFTLKYPPLGRGVFATKSFAEGIIVEVCRTMELHKKLVNGKLTDYVYYSEKLKNWRFIMLGYGMFYNSSTANLAMPMANDLFM